MDFYNEFLNRLRNGDDANAIANEITKALNDSIKAKAEEDEVAKKAKLDAEVKARCAKVKAAENDMNDYLDVMIEYVNDYLDAYADAHERSKRESMDKDELRSLLDSWAELHGWINKVSKMDMSDVLDELGSLWADLSIAERVKNNNWNTKVDAKTSVDTDDLKAIYDVRDNEPCKKDGVTYDCNKSVKKPIKATTVHIKDDMSADDIINEFLKALDKL